MRMTRSLSVGLTVGLLFSTRETVAFETPARRAISWMVNFSCMPSSLPLRQFPAKGRNTVLCHRYYGRERARANFLCKNYNPETGFCQGPTFSVMLSESEASDLAMSTRGLP